ncbi:ABC transporter substrate-binding protein [Seohaeicola zhoushanensis]
MKHYRFKGLALAAALALAAPFVKAATPPDTLMVAQAIDGVISFDPAEVFEFVSGEVSNNVYLRLVARDEDDQTKLVGGAAESWEVSEDGMTLTFKMRPDLVFASGNPVTSADAAFSLQRVVTLNKSPAFILTQFGWTPRTLPKW